jgi:glyoxylase-like metal-dependent hydrolase (beta-lactamase superfamily II)
MIFERRALVRLFLLTAGHMVLPVAHQAKSGERRVDSKLNGIIVPVTGFQQNCTLLFDEVSKTGVVVDPGGDVDRIVEVVAEQGLTIEAIWLTHGHIDHAGGAMDLKDRLAVDIVGPHKDDLPLLTGLEQQARMFGIDMAVRDVTPDRWLDDGDTVGFAGFSFDVLHCPGHAPGHVIFVNRAARFAHVGDVLFRGSIGRTDLPGGDHDALIHSIKTKVLPLGDDIGFICGHGPGGNFGEERRSNPFLT